jgi:uncharacterized protein (TIGR02996 family)
MHPVEEGFRQAIIDNPADAFVRLVFADWLDDRGDPRGEFIRVQIELSGDPNRGRRDELEARERDLLYHHRADWLSVLGENWHGDAVFERGFVVQVTVGAREFIRHAERWLRYEPIRNVSLYGAVDCMRELADCPSLARLSALDLRKNELANSQIQELVNSPYLSQLAQLDLSNNYLGPASGALVANAPSLGGLKEVCFEGNNNLYDVKDNIIAMFRTPKRFWRFSALPMRALPPPAPPQS